MSFKLRDYQDKIIDEGSAMLGKNGFVYLAMQVRCGKTLTSLGICEKIGAKTVLFLTKKKAISSITSDFALLNPSFEMECINYESMHKLPPMKFDVVILDESHGMGAFPKPSKRAKDVRALIARHRCKVILLSGTPTPESFSQMYHQVYAIQNNPFARYKNFYRFADDHVTPKQRMINGRMMNDYSGGKGTIISLMQPYTINFTQKEAGFVVDTTEHVIRVQMKGSTYSLAKKLKRDLVVEGSEEVILADTPVKLMMKLHQIYSGTVKFESGASMVLDNTKADFIYNNFSGQKIGIFYKFTAELKALKEAFGDDLCTELEEFDSTDKSIALQIVSGREGISLRKADALVYYNIDFSATSYWQSRDRMTTKDRLKGDIYWIFSDGGIEDDIYKAVMSKKSYTSRHFVKKLKQEEL